MTAIGHGAVAAVDCGTNSTRLLVLDSEGRRLERLMTITRLGEGVDETGFLSDGALTRTFTVLREYRAVLDHHGVTRVRAAATSATRDAGNRDEFLDGAAAILGSRPEVIGGSEEGRLSFVGATRALPPDPREGHAAGSVVVVDVGGGSTELIVGSPSSPAPRAVESMDIGCVRATERYLKSDPPTTAETAAARNGVRAIVDAVLERQPAFREATLCIGLAGTVSALTVLALGLDGFDEERVHHAHLRLEVIEQLISRLAALPLAERRAVRGMEVERADVLVGGAIVLAEVLSALGLDELLASEADILDGIALELLRAGAGPP